MLWPKNSDNVAAPLTNFMPHRAPMLLLNKLEEFSTEGARATVDLCAGNPFLREDGLLERVAYAEIMAQCFAAGAGACERASGGSASSLGYLAALRDVVVHADARQGQRLTVAVRVTASLGALTVVEGEVRAADVLLASGQFKIFIPQEGA